jgi:hypothetical protein
MLQPSLFSLRNNPNAAYSRRHYVRDGGGGGGVLASVGYKILILQSYVRSTYR